MAITSEVAEILSGFEKRMKYINIVRFILDYKYPDHIKEMFPDNNVPYACAGREYLDNIVFAVLLLIKERTLGTAQSCDVQDVEEFLTDIMPILPFRERVNPGILAKYIMDQVLRKGGALAEYLCYHSEKQGFEMVPVRLINENRGQFTLTNDGFDFLFRTKEIETELDYSVTRFRVQEYMKRNNYKEAQETSRDLVSRVRNIKNSMADFLLRCKENINLIPVDLFEQIMGNVRNLLETEYHELEDIRTSAQRRAEELDEAKNSGIDTETMRENRKALREIETNISLAINEQRDLIIRRTSMAAEYQQLLRDSFSARKYERLDFEKDILLPLRQAGDALGDAAKNLLYLLTKPELPRMGSIESLYEFAPYHIVDSNNEDSIDIENGEVRDQTIIKVRNQRNKEITQSFFTYAEDRRTFYISDYFDSLTMANIKWFCEDDALPNMVLFFYKEGELNIEKFKTNPPFIMEPSGELDLGWELSALPDNLLKMKKITFGETCGMTTLHIIAENKKRVIEISNFEVNIAYE